MKEFEVIIDKKGFLDWRWSDSEDLSALADDIIKIFKKKGQVNLLLEDVFRTTGYISEQYVLNWEKIPDEFKDVEEEELLPESLPKNCKIIFK